MDLILQRKAYDVESTEGELLLQGTHVCYTLEDTVRERSGVPVSEWKIKERTAIPTGRYKVTLEDSRRFGPETLSLANVPGFYAIRMHAGNTSDDTEGCVLLGGQVKDGKIVGGTSRPAVAHVKSLVRAAVERGEDVWLEIINPPGYGA